MYSVGRSALRSSAPWVRQRLPTMGGFRPPGCSLRGGSRSGYLGGTSRNSSITKGAPELGQDDGQAFGQQEQSLRIDEGGILFSNLRTPLHWSTLSQKPNHSTLTSLLGGTASERQAPQRPTR
jgi:hypothetical protein